MTRGLHKTTILFWGILLSALSTHLLSQKIAFERPGPREFVIDKARLLDPNDIESIKKTCDRLFTDHTIPLMVVTIESMRHHTFQTITIEQFTRTLYDQWNIGSLQKNGKPWNKGILLLISQNDRRACIELGAGYGHTKDVECAAIMENKIIRQFKAARFSDGIRSGVAALDLMVRETEGEGPVAWFLNPWFIGIAVLFILIIIWLVCTGRNGSARVIRLAIYSGVGWWAYSRVTDVVLALMIFGAGLFEIILVLKAFGFLGGWNGYRIGGDSYSSGYYNSGFFGSGWGGFSGGGGGGGFSGGGEGGFSGGGGASGSW